MGEIFGIDTRFKPAIMYLYIKYTIQTEVIHHRNHYQQQCQQTNL